MKLCIHAYIAGAVGTVGLVGGIYTCIKVYQRFTRLRLPQKWTQVGKLNHIYIYPVKSCAPVSLDKAECSILGPRNGAWLRDRFLMVMDDKNVFKTARQFPDLVTVIPSIKGSVLTLNHKVMEPLHVNLSEVAENSKKEMAEIWNVPVPVYDCGIEASEWFTKFLNQPAGTLKLALYASDKCPKPVITTPTPYKFTKNDTGVFQDDTAYDLINEASVEELNTRLKDSVSHRSFRPNFVVEGATAFEEDKWKFVKIGDNIFEIIKPCTRCVLTTVDPDTGVRNANNEPLATLKSYRQVQEPELRKVEGESPRMGLQLALRSDPGRYVNINDPIFAA